MKQRRTMLRYVGMGVVCALFTYAVLLAKGHAQSITWLSTPDGSMTQVTKISADGSVVAGMSFGEPAYWENGRIYPLGIQRGEVLGASPDCRVIVGRMIVSGVDRAFRWTQATGVQDLGTLGGSWSIAQDASADGNVVVGVSTFPSGFRRAFRWRPTTGMQDLGTLGGQQSWAYGVSPDGRVVVGTAQAGGQWRAFRWTLGTGMQDIGALGEANTAAYAISANGQVIIGATFESWNFAPYLGVHWENGVMREITPPDGYNRVIPYALSSDGSVIVGTMRTLAGSLRPFRWTREKGVQDLNQFYSFLLPTGSVLYEAKAISADGRFIAGIGYNIVRGRIEAFLLDTQCQSHNGDIDGGGCVDDEDLLLILFNFGRTGDALGRLDPNCDGAIDDADLLTVLFNFGSGC